MLVLLTGLTEDGKAKADKYWPEDRGYWDLGGGARVEHKGTTDYDTYCLRQERARSTWSGHFLAKGPGF